jgi:hypothetical protein
MRLTSTIWDDWAGSRLCIGCCLPTRCNALGPASAHPLTINLQYLPVCAAVVMVRYTLSYFRAAIYMMKSSTIRSFHVSLDL